MMGHIQELEKQYIINTYNRQADSTPCLVRGEGSYVWDDRGKKYLDLLGGLAVNLVGHCHPAVVKAICAQADTLIHTSNLYYTGPQAELARILVEETMPGGKVFFANSGAEVNEGAIKLARKQGQGQGRYKIITALNSFHGRTMATLTATGQVKYHESFKPLVDGFAYGRFNDLQSFEELVDDETAAILIEPVQGEGGVHVAEASFIRGLRELCDRREMVLIFDEVQCGMGRTGKLWAGDHFNVKPDLLTAAKGLGGGLPIGVLVAAEKYADVLVPGDHASTFGGNPVACGAALAVMEIILGAGFLYEVAQKGEMLNNALLKMKAAYPDLIEEYRGLGLICALELKRPLAKELLQKSTEKGLLINAIGETTLRLLPPLTVSEEELDEGLNLLNGLLAERA